jgi:myxalamid-type polyketide synthase MxaB
LLTQEHPLDFFIFFSSAASLLGAVGQVNYCAANAFLDTLAQMRQQMGLPALSINWGAWGKIGMAAKSSATSKSIPGMGEIDPQAGLKILEQLLSSSLSQVGIMQIDWTEISSLNLPFFANLNLETSQNIPEKETSQTDFLHQLQQLSPHQQKQELITHLSSQVNTVLGLNPLQSIALDQGFSELGLDSLTSIELRNRLQISFNCILPSTLAFDHPTINQLADYLAKKLLFSHLKSNLNHPTLTSEIEAIKELSETEAEALLIHELESLQIPGISDSN